MNTFSKILGSWEFWVMVGLFILSFILMSTIESISIYKDTLLPILGFLPAVAIWYILFVKPTIK